MYKFLSNNGQSVAFGLGLLISAIFFINIFIGLESFNVLTDDEKYTTNIFNFGLTAMIVMTVVAVILLFAFGVYQVVNDFKSSRPGLIGLGILIAIFIVSYFLASETPTGSVAQAVEKAGGISPTIFRLLGGGLNMMIILMGLTFVAFVVAEIRNLFK